MIRRETKRDTVIPAEVLAEALALPPEVQRRTVDAGWARFLLIRAGPLRGQVRVLLELGSAPRCRRFRARCSHAS